MHAWAEVCHVLQSSKSPLTGFLCSIGWRIIDQTRLSSNTLHTNSISNSAILCNNCISLLSDLCACVHVKKKWRRKGSHSSSVSGLNCFVWLQTWKKEMGWYTAQWKMLLFCAKNIMKESRKFELARLKQKKNKKKKKKKEKHFGRLATFWFDTFAMLFLSSSDGLVQICVTLSRWFWHKTAAFFTEQCTSQSLFFQVWSHTRWLTEELWLPLRRHFSSPVRMRTNHFELWTFSNEI